MLKLKKMKSTKKQIEDAILQMEEKYFDLVWFARRSEDALLILTEEGVVPHKEAHAAVHRIASLYPEDVQELMQDEDNWQHGFNSGMLAGMRYILTVFHDGQETAADEFPFLDT
jgi:hypothetical protein